MAEFTPRYRKALERTSANSLEEVMEKRTNHFDELDVRQLETQWKHKISVIPETAGDGIPTRWWDYSAGVSRAGPEAHIPGGEYIGTNESGEYNVGDPALAGGAFRIEGDATSGDDVWTGYSNRLGKAVGDNDGAGIGRKYFDVGDGDEGGAESSGGQDYVWFRSSVSGVGNLEVPRDQWNGENVNEIPDNLTPTKAGGFLRIDFTFYNQGQVDVNWGVKTASDVKIYTLHTFIVDNDPMWGQSDLKWQTEATGTGLDGFVNAAHFKAGNEGRNIRSNGEVRDGTVAGETVSMSQGTPVPIISLTKRADWENINQTIENITISTDSSYYVFISVDPDLQGATFDVPMSDLTGVNPEPTEYSVLADNVATGFGTTVGEVEYINYVSPAGRGSQSSELSDEMNSLALGEDKVATIGIIPIDATTFNGASVRWVCNF